MKGLKVLFKACCGAAALRLQALFSAACCLRRGFNCFFALVSQHIRGWEKDHFLLRAWWTSVLHPCFTACLVCDLLVYCRATDSRKRPKIVHFLFRDEATHWHLSNFGQVWRRTCLNPIFNQHFSESSWFQVSSEQETAEEVFLPPSFSDFASIRGIPSNIWSSLRWKEVTQLFYLSLCTQWEEPTFI